MSLSTIYYRLKNCLLIESDPGCFSQRTGYSSRTSYSPSAFGIFAAHKMPATTAFVPDFAGSSNFESFAQALMAFLFRHLINSFKIIYPKQSNDINPVLYVIGGC